MSRVLAEFHYVVGRNIPFTVILIDASLGAKARDAGINGSISWRRLDHHRVLWGTNGEDEEDTHIQSEVRAYGVASRVVTAIQQASTEGEIASRLKGFFLISLDHRANGVVSSQAQTVEDDLFASRRAVYACQKVCRSSTSKVKSNQKYHISPSITATLSSVHITITHILLLKVRTGSYGNDGSRS